MPLRFPRPVMPVIATVIAAVWVVAGNAPAFADQVRAQEWWLSALDVTPAWQAAKGGGVTVAVLSDGVDAAHADLAGAVTVGPDFTNSGETTSTFTGLQGTAIASLIAGRGHGSGHSSGAVGVAPRARVLSIRVTLDPADPALDHAAVGLGLPDAIANGIRYAVAHHAKVIDLPVDPAQPSPAQVAALPVPPKQTTAPQLTGITAAAGGSTAEKAAVAYAVRKGVVLVAPAGDNGIGTDAANFPAAYPGVIAVGAFDQNFVRAAYSSRQPYVALTAGGTGVIAADALGGYQVINSTSAASAMVSGIAALIRARFPGLSAAQVTTALTSSAVYRPAGATSSGSGSGTVDAGRALVAAAAMAAPANERAGAGAVSWAAPAAPSAVPVASDGLAPRVLRAAIISAAALILLLLLVASYAATGRRKERKEARDAKAATDWARSTQNAYSPYGSGEADQMLEYFAAPSSNPSSPVSPVDPFAAFQGAQLAGPGSAGAPSLGAQFPASQVAAERTSDAADSSSTGALAASSAGAAGRGVDAWVPLGAASRAQSRQPRVSGAPPWEPAAEPNSELPWAAVPAPSAGSAGPARPQPAVAPSPPSDSIWAATAPAAPKPSPSGQAWDDLVAGVPPEAEARPAAIPAPPWSVGDAPAPAGSPPAAFSSPAPAAPAAPATPSAASASDLPASAGSLWQPRTTPRSPSGSAWELPDSEPGRQPSAAQDAQWQQADGDAFRQPATAKPAWPPAGGQAGWQSATEQAPAAPAGDPWAAPELQAAGQPWTPTEISSAGATRATGEAGAAGQDESASDEAAWDAQGSGGGTHWLATAVSERWQPAAPSSQWEPAADTGDASTGDDTGAHWQPSGAASSPWQSPVADPLWGPATDAPAADSPRGSAAGTADSMQWGTPSGTQWDSAAADSGWHTTADAAWDTPSPQARWDATDRAGDSAADEAEPYAWRPSAPTETFPAVSDD